MKYEANLRKSLFFAPTAAGPTPLAAMVQAVRNARLYGHDPLDGRVWAIHVFTNNANGESGS